MRHADPLILLLLPLRVARLEQLRWAKAGHELGYLAHYAMGGAVGGPPPAPYHVQDTSQDRGGMVWVSAYGHRTVSDLRRNTRAERPDWREGICWSTALDYPVRIVAGQETAFRVRCAAVRRRKAGSGWSAEVPVPHAEMRDWFAGEMRGCSLLGQLEVQPAMLDTTRPLGWAAGRQGGAPAPYSVPTLTVSGRLRVEDAATFTYALGRGVGRHRTYGLGMVRLGED